MWYHYVKTNKKCKFLKDDRPPIVSDTAIRSFAIGQKKSKFHWTTEHAWSGTKQYAFLTYLHTVILMGEKWVFFKDIAVSLGFFKKKNVLKSAFRIPLSIVKSQIICARKRCKKKIRLSHWYKKPSCSFLTTEEYSTNCIVVH